MEFQQLQSASQLLLKDNEQLDVNLLDFVIKYVSSSNFEVKSFAEKTLEEFKKKPNSLYMVSTILNSQASTQTKIFALQILGNAVKARWKIIPEQDRTGIKNFVVVLIVRMSNNQQTKQEQPVLNKLGAVITDIVKAEWPHGWKSFIPEIISASQTSEPMCRVSIEILKALSEELFENEGKMTNAKAKHLKSIMCQEFSSVFVFFETVLKSSTSHNIITESIQALSHYVTWIPAAYIFEKDLFYFILQKYGTSHSFIIGVLDLFSEISQIKLTQYNSQQMNYFMAFMNIINNIVQEGKLLASIRDSDGSAQQAFCRKLTVYLSSFMRKHLETIFFTDIFVNICSNVKQALSYLNYLCYSIDKEIFKITIEFYHDFAKLLYSSTAKGHSNQITHTTNILIDEISKLRRCLIHNMPRPEEVTIMENESGEVVREHMKDTENINYYHLTKDTLVLVTKVDYQDTIKILRDELLIIQESLSFNRKKTNSVSWSVGSISGCLDIDSERQFLVLFIRELLNLCEKSKGKGNKALIASNIMYVVRKYPRFLNAYYKFLYTVCLKLFEFMHESHEGVKDMSCDTFLKLATKCGPLFVYLQKDEETTLLQYIVENINLIIVDLEKHQINIFFKALAIACSSATGEQEKISAFQLLIQFPNTMWTNIKSQINNNKLFDNDVIEMVLDFLRLNSSIASVIGDVFHLQLTKIYTEICQIYKCITDKLSELMSFQGYDVLKLFQVKKMRSVRKEILNLLEHAIKGANNLECIEKVYLSFVMKYILESYNNSYSKAKDHEVLNVLSSTITKLGVKSVPYVSAILNYTFECTIKIIHAENSEFPELTASYFQLIESIITYSFESVIHIKDDGTNLLFNSIVWAFNVTQPGISKIALSIIYKLYCNFSKPQYVTTSIAQSFFLTHYLNTIMSVFSMLLYAPIQTSLTNESLLICLLVGLVEEKYIKTSLFNKDQPPSTEQEIINIKGYLIAQIHSRLPHFKHKQLILFIEGLFTFNKNHNRLLTHLNDFLIQTKEVQNEDCDDLFFEEAYREIQFEKDKKKTLPSFVTNILANNLFEDVD